MNHAELIVGQSDSSVALAPRARWSWVFVLPVVGLACATAPPAPATAGVAAATPAPVGSPSPTPRMLLPVFRSTVPTEPWLDLGPIIVRRGRSEDEVTSELLAQAEAIGATGFIVEGRGEERLGASGGAGVAFARPGSAGGALGIAVIAGLVALAQRDEPRPTSPRAVSSLRAYRLVREPPPRGPLDGPEVQALPAEVRRALAAAPDLARQLAALEAAFVRQAIDVDRFDRAREALCGPGRG
jgi:hypothetical protein